MPRLKQPRVSSPFPSRSSSPSLSSFPCNSNSFSLSSSFHSQLFLSPSTFTSLHSRHHCSSTGESVLIDDRSNLVPSLSCLTQQPVQIFTSSSPSSSSSSSSPPFISGKFSLLLSFLVCLLLFLTVQTDMRMGMRIRMVSADETDTTTAAATATGVTAGDGSILLSSSGMSLLCSLNCNFGHCELIAHNYSSINHTSSDSAQGTSSSSQPYPTCICDPPYSGLDCNHIVSEKIEPMWSYSSRIIAGLLLAVGILFGVERMWSWWKRRQARRSGREGFSVLWNRDVIGLEGEEEDELEMEMEHEMEQEHRELEMQSNRGQGKSGIGGEIELGLGGDDESGL